MQNTALFPLIDGGGIVDGRSVTALRSCCSETLLKPTWMLNHRCRANDKEEQTDDAHLQQQMMIVAHGSWVMLSSLLEPFYVMGRLRKVFAMQRSEAGAAWI